MTTEDWHNVLYRSLDPWVNRPNGTKQAGYWLSTYFIVAVIVGGCILKTVNFDFFLCRIQWYALIWYGVT